MNDINFYFLMTDFIIILFQECSRCSNCNLKFNFWLFIIWFTKILPMTEDTRFDGVFMSMIQQKGNIDGFFDGVFGFLRRNTDFFANQKKAE